MVNSFFSFLKVHSKFFTRVNKNLKNFFLFLGNLIYNFSIFILICIIVPLDLIFKLVSAHLGSILFFIAITLILNLIKNLASNFLNHLFYMEGFEDCCNFSKRFKRGPIGLALSEYWGLPRIKLSLDLEENYLLNELQNLEISDNSREKEGKVYLNYCFTCGKYHEIEHVEFLGEIKNDHITPPVERVYIKIKKEFTGQNIEYLESSKQEPFENNFFRNLREYSPLFFKIFSSPLKYFPLNLIFRLPEDLKLVSRRSLKLNSLDGFVKSNKVLDEKYASIIKRNRDLYQPIALDTTLDSDHQRINDWISGKKGAYLGFSPENLEFLFKQLDDLRSKVESITPNYKLKGQHSSVNFVYDYKYHKIEAVSED